MVALLVALVCETGWLTAMVVRSGNVGPLARLWTPIALTALPLAVTLVVPLVLLENTGIGPWMVLAREKGAFRRADAWLALMFAALAVVALLAPTSSYKATLVALSFDAAASIAAAFLQEQITITWKTWPIHVPEWLRRNLKDEERKSGGGTAEPVDLLIPPDADARPVYSLEAIPGTIYPVGIRIPLEILQRLRTINAQNQGTLYQRESEAVVLMDRPPVDNIGRDEVLRLCAQILSIARKHQLPPLAFANMVLNFVQKAIRYRFDKDSTSDFQGGPYDEYGRFAVETIQDEVGDCECTSLLCASLLAYLGFGVALLWVAVPTGGENKAVNHVAVGLDAACVSGADLSQVGFDLVDATDGSGRKYLYGETALDGLTLPFGCIPGEWRELRIDRVAALVPLK